MGTNFKRDEATMETEVKSVFILDLLGYFEAMKMEIVNFKVIKGKVEKGSFVGKFMRR